MQFFCHFSPSDADTYQAGKGLDFGSQRCILGQAQSVGRQLGLPAFSAETVRCGVARLVRDAGTATGDSCVGAGRYQMASRHACPAPGVE